MKKNALLLFTLIAGFVIARIVGSIIIFNGNKFKMNQQITREIIKVLTIKPTDISKTQFVGSVESLARCLAERNFRMYGTPDCSACATQRDYFGQYFALVPYIDCYQQKELCRSKNITAYPTWEDKDGNKYKGAIPLDILSQLSGCPVPKKFTI